MENIISVQEQIVSDAIKKLENKMEDLLIQGLRNKGYEFEDRYELKLFIATYCRCEDYQDKGEKIYFVKDLPFFLHIYKVDSLVNTNKGNSISINYGNYAFL